MGLNIGNTTIGGIYLGNTKISEAYLGSTKIYSAAPPGPTFDYVTIGSQIWMSKNLAIDDGQGGIYTQTVNYGQGDVVEYYYIWDAAVRVAASISGWHLPSQTEWNTLTTTAGGNSNAGKKLKATYGWKYSYAKGTDDFGFTALPASYWYNDSGTEWKYNSSAVGEGTTFWTSNSSSSSVAYDRYIVTNASIYSDSSNKTRRAYSVRLVKD